jgi:hypothetical protein
MRLRPRTDIVFSSGRGKGRTDGDLRPLGHALADEEVVLVADVGDDVLVHLVAGDADGAADDDAAHGKDGHFGRAAADVDDHAAARFDDRQPGADGRGHWLFDQIRLARAGGDGGVVDGALLYLGDAAGHADDDARPGEGHEHLLVGLVDEVLEHRLGDLELGDDAVAQGADGDDVAGGAADHLARLGADGQRPAGALVDRHPRRFVDDDALIAHGHQCVGRTQVDADVEREDAQQPV